jgi:hypothetical protein
MGEGRPTVHRAGARAVCSRLKSDDVARTMAFPGARLLFSTQRKTLSCRFNFAAQDATPS